MSNSRRVSPLFLIFCYFLFPAYDPGESYHYPIENNYDLSGTFGELRPNHFHSGIDIKTYRKVGFKIFAAQEGYLYRIKISPYSYGKAIYMRHPDGRFSVYAHLSGFVPEIEEFVRERQRKAEQFEQEIYLEKDQITFKRGELIGYSGTSGNSFGPHLHFELRDPSERIINALPYFDALIKDNIKPSLLKVAFEPLSTNSRIDKRYAKKSFTVQGKDGAYSLEDTVRLEGPVGLEYFAFDKLNGAYNRCGINYARLYLDEQLIYSFELDVFAFDETHNINMHMDYAHYKRYGQRLQKAYIDEGNRFSAYGQVVNDGVIELADDQAHRLRLELEDAHGNSIAMRANLKRAQAEEEAVILAKNPVKAQLEAEIKRDMLIIHAKHGGSAANMLTLKTQFGEPIPLLPSYQGNGQTTYLHPLDGINYPQEITDPEGNLLLQTHLKEKVDPAQNQIVAFQGIQAYFPHDALFFPTHLQIQEKSKPKAAFSPVYQVASHDIPVRDFFWISFEPSWPAHLAEHLVVAYKGKKGWKYAGNKLGADGRLYARARNFGAFCVMLDSTAPSLVPLNFSNGSSIPQENATLTLKLEDSFSDIASKSIRASLDGQWVPFEYNFRNKQINSRWKNRPAAGKHTLVITAQDGAGNEVKRTFDLRF